MQPSMGERNYRYSAFATEGRARRFPSMELPQPVQPREGQSSVQNSGRRPKYYKPVATRTPVLLLVLVITLLCIGFLEIILHEGTGPQSESRTKTRSLNSIEPNHLAGWPSRVIEKREPSGPEDTPTAAATTNANGAASTTAASAAATTNVDGASPEGDPVVTTTTTRTTIAVTTPLTTTTPRTTTIPALTTTTTTHNTTTPALTTTTTHNTTTPALTTTTTTHNTTTPALTTTTTTHNTTTPAPTTTTTHNTTTTVLTTTTTSNSTATLLTTTTTTSNTTTPLVTTTSNSTTPSTSVTTTTSLNTTTTVATTTTTTVTSTSTPRSTTPLTTTTTPSLTTTPSTTTPTTIRSTTLTTSLTTTPSILSTTPLTTTSTSQPSSSSTVPPTTTPVTPSGSSTTTSVTLVVTTSSVISTTVSASTATASNPSNPTTAPISSSVSNSVTPSSVATSSNSNSIPATNPNSTSNPATPATTATASNSNSTPASNPTSASNPATPASNPTTASNPTSGSNPSTLSNPTTVSGTITASNLVTALTAAVVSSLDTSATVSSDAGHTVVLQSSTRGSTQGTEAITLVALSTSAGAKEGEAATTTSSGLTLSTPFTDTKLDTNELKMPPPFRPTDYFNAQFAPIVISVLFKDAWCIVYTAMKMMEPFYQLAKPDGASAQESLLSDYLSSGLSWSALKNFTNRHWVMSISTMIYLVFSILTSVASESMTVRAENICPTRFGQQPCDPMWVVKIPVVRALEAGLALIAVLIVVIIVMNWRRPSGVFSYPCSIASMAALFGHLGVIHDFRRVHPDADDDDLQKSLAANRYFLENYEAAPGVVRYGITKRLGPLARTSSQLSEYEALPNPGNELKSNKKRTIPWFDIVDVVFLLIQLALFGAILAYALTGNEDEQHSIHFLNQRSFGPRFILTLVAMVIGEGWKRLERQVRIIVPYRRLHQRDALSRDLVLMSMHGVPLTTFPFAVWYRNFYHAFIALIAISADFLVIVIAGVPFTYGQVRDLSLVSSFVALAILAVMIFSIISLLVWRRGNPKMPRQPETLAAVLMILCGSHMLADFEGMEGVPLKSRNLAVKASGRRYWAGQSAGVDGKERYMIDQDLRSLEEI